ncbi:hypothetical protein [Alkalilimnicola ehrlichii]|uniref:hypothetical protein n=1 Tax=Alkalilimnicola ehrlichii TaxID=351052 RepID=UPI0021612B5F|nr:hypothetical protein [Alkalilimnicola ehrlichii]
MAIFLGHVRSLFGESVDALLRVASGERRLLLRIDSLSSGPLASALGAISQRRRRR